jgi:hypothetical protein
MHYIQALRPFLHGLEDNWIWLIGTLLMVEPLLDQLLSGYRAWADQWVSRKIRTRVAWAVTIVSVYIAMFMAFAGEFQTAERLRGELATKSAVPAAPPVTAVEKYICSTVVSARTAGNFAILFEFGVKGFSTNGFAAMVAIDQPIAKEMDWQGAPLRTDIPPNMGGASMNSTSQISGNVYRRSFSFPNVTPQDSEYIYIEAKSAFNVLKVLYLEDFSALSDPVRANKLATQYKTCPR